MIDMLGAFVVERKKVVRGWFHICKNTSISAGMKVMSIRFPPIDDPLHMALIKRFREVALHSSL